MQQFEDVIDRKFALVGEDVVVRATGRILKTRATGYTKCFLCTLPDGRAKMVQYHRLKWFLKYRGWPSVVDHRDRNPSNNLFSNLRGSTSAGNMHNRAKFRGCLPRGVKLSRSGKRYQGVVSVAGKKHFVGSFLTEGEASDAVEAKLQEVYQDDYSRP